MRSLWVVALVSLMPMSGANASSECETAALSKLVPVGSSAVSAAGGYGVLLTSEFRACRFGNYSVLVSTDAETDLLLVLRGSEVLVATGLSTPIPLESGQSLPAPLGEGYWLAVWQRDRVLLTLGGRETDVTFSELSYFPTGSEPGRVRSVSDMNLDGQQDMRTFGPFGASAEVWVDGRWYDLEFEDDHRFVRVGDTRRRVLHTPDGWKFAGD